MATAVKMPRKGLAGFVSLNRGQISQYDHSFYSVILPDCLNCDGVLELMRQMPASQEDYNRMNSVIGCIQSKLQKAGEIRKARLTGKHFDTLASPGQVALAISTS